MDINLNAKQSGSQTRRILAYLQQGNSLTALEASHLFDTLNLRSRISDIEKLGYIVARMYIRTQSGKYVKKYWLDKQN